MWEFKGTCSPDGDIIQAETSYSIWVNWIIENEIKEIL